MTDAREWIPRSQAPRFAQRLRDRRTAAGMTQRELAVRAGLAKSTLVHWELGRVPQTIAATTFSALETALQVPPGWLCSPGNEPVPPDVVHAAFRVANAADCEEGDHRPAPAPPARCEETA